MIKFTNIFKSNDEISRLEQVSADWATKYAQLEEAYNLKLKDIEAFMVEKESFSKQIEDLKATQKAEMDTLIKGHEEALKELNEKIQVADTNSGEKAATIVASIGLDPEATPSVNPVEILQTNNTKGYKVIPFVKNNNK
jgi:predicted  nucleic acid-binding Zn-ribbon protein